MRLRNIPGSREAIALSSRVISEEQMGECRGRWQEIFGNDHPLCLEIGTGKGRFVTAMACAHPEYNYVGIEKYSSVLVRALEKLPEKDAPRNLLFLRMDAEQLCDVFGADEVSCIYLNFPDPWPKDRHAKRRLPGRQFLRRYEQILTGKGRVEFKTDNPDLFDFALESAEAEGWRILSCTRDLHRDPVMNSGNVMTEYEEKFSKIGNPICKVILLPPFYND